LFTIDGKPVTGIWVGFLIGGVLSCLTILAEDNVDGGGLENFGYLPGAEVDFFTKVPLYLLLIWGHFFLMIFSILLFVGAVIGFIWLIIYLIGQGY